MRLLHPLPLAWASEVMEGRLDASSPASISSVTTDTRNLEPGALFFALHGANCDGSRYVPAAEKAGAVAAVIRGSDAGFVRAHANLPLILVDDPLTSLWKFSHAMLAPYTDVTYIGVTGSCGKSTTKEAISAILSVHGQTVKTPGNLNSEIGLPLSVLQVGPSTRYGVFEMGVDHVGEMEHMLGVVKPDMAVLTNIGVSHLEKFGTREAIAHEKGGIFHPSLQAGFISSDCDFINQIQQERGLVLGRYASSDLDAEDLGLSGWLLHFGSCQSHVKAMGRHLLTDIAAAVRVARALGISDREIARGLDGFHPLEGRATVIDGDVTIIEDCYNASPDSTCSMLDAMSRLSWRAGGKKVVLGTMKELGPASRSAHQQVARGILSSGIDGAFLFGDEMRDAYSLLKDAGYKGELSYSDDFGDLAAQVQNGVRKGDLCLIKGSRAMMMERLIPVLRRVG